MGSRMSSIVLLVPLVVALGCAESTLIRTSPANAKVSYRGRLVGIAPAELVVPHGDLRNPIVIHVEHEGYQSQDVPIPTQIGAARIVGAIFSLGLSFTFKPPTTLPDETDVALESLPAAPVVVAPSQQPAPPRREADVEERLHRLQELYERGYITELEYRRRRAAILDEL